MARVNCSVNMNAFLDTVAHSEGTPQTSNSDDGYNVLVGGTVDGVEITHRLFGQPPVCYIDHPRELVEVKPGLKSTAAGRYQLLAHYFDFYKQKLGLKDFGPVAQDMIAIEQMQESKALRLIESGNFAQAITSCAHIWASLPGAGYGQHENKLADLQETYLNAGGKLA